MAKLRLYVMDHKELELADKLLSTDYIESVEIHDKNQDEAGYTAEIVAFGHFEEQELLWLGMELGPESSRYLCWSKFIKT